MAEGAYIGVDPEYQNTASHHGLPLFSDEGAECELQVNAAVAQARLHAATDREGAVPTRLVPFGQENR